MRAIIEGSRPRQMIKNGLVLVPLFFTVNIWFSTSDLSGMTTIVVKAFAALGIFILLSAAIYLFNDSVDVEKDRMHPKKKLRPIASGKISVHKAYAVSLLMMIAALAASLYISSPMILTSGFYLIINVAYTYWLKNIVILDVMTIASGFVLRAMAGSIAIDQTTIIQNNVPTEVALTISPWLYVVTALGALFIALAKRRNELHLAGSNSSAQRPILNDYSIALLDNLINVVAAATLIAYTFYTFSTGISEANVPSNHSMMFTIPFVAYGVLRYLYLIHIDEVGETPEEIVIRDKPLLINILLWLVTGSSVLMWTRLNI